MNKTIVPALSNKNLEFIWVRFYFDLRRQIVQSSAQHRLKPIPKLRQEMVARSSWFPQITFNLTPGQALF